MNLSNLRLLASLGLMAVALPAMPIIQPGIGPNVDYRLVFVTSALQFQNSNNLHGCVNQIGGFGCVTPGSIIANSDLDTLLPNATWRLVGSMLNGLNALDNTNHDDPATLAFDGDATLANLPVYDLQGNLVSMGLFNAHGRGIIYDEFGNDQSGASVRDVYTGSTTAGAANAGFEFGGGGVTTSFGTLTASNDSWIQNGTSGGIGSAGRWYIVSGRLTTDANNPLIPEPSTYVLVATGIGAILYRRYRRS